MSTSRIVRLFLVVTLLAPAICYGAKQKAKAVEQTSTETEIQRGINVRVNPLGLLVGALSGDVDFALSNKFTVGPSIGYFSAGIFGVQPGS